jgi:predicted glycoside hydrolase/deacetylase ChbG (UPF0249 family)
MRRTRTLGLAIGFALITAPSMLAQGGGASATVGPPQVLLRLDDAGMNHSVNVAMQRVAETGVPLSVSVLFAGPWYQEAVEILKRYPNISVGVHLAVNSEWKGYRWGPVLGAATVPSLVDTNGYFLHSASEFLARKYDLAEVERELGAQVERAMRSGLRIDYVDYHMATAVATPALRAVVERVAAKYRLGISRYFGESVIDLFTIAPAHKGDSLVSRLRVLSAPVVHVAVIHVAEDTPEMRALVDMNSPLMNTPAGEPLTWAHRKAELEMMLSPVVRAALRGVRLVTYRDVIAARGLASMRSPGGR